MRCDRPLDLAEEWVDRKRNVESYADIAIGRLVRYAELEIADWQRAARSVTRLEVERVQTDWEREGRAEVSIVAALEWLGRAESAEEEGGSIDFMRTLRTVRV